MTFSFRASENGFVHVCGHRGHMLGAPENTLAAIRAAHRHGGTTAEIDTVLTADGAIIVLHDLSLDRTTDRTGVVGQRTLAEIEHCDAGSWFDAEFAGERVPTLSQALELARELDMGLEVEIKEKLRLGPYCRGSGGGACRCRRPCPDDDDLLRPRQPGHRQTGHSRHPHRRHRTTALRRSGRRRDSRRPRPALHRSRRLPPGRRPPVARERHHDPLPRL